MWTKCAYNGFSTPDRDGFVEDVDLGKVMSENKASTGEVLANSLMFFVLLCGLSASYRIPAGYFFTNECTCTLVMLIVDRKHGITPSPANKFFKP